MNPQLKARGRLMEPDRCAAHLLRELRAFHTADPDAQLWAAAIADTLTDAHHRAQTARAAGHDTLDPQALATIRNHYRGAAGLGITTNSARAGPLAADALRLARRFRNHEDMILRFVVDLNRFGAWPAGRPPDRSHV
jgi:transposase